ncbi:Bifunctional inhibitor/plant lipid transfer protein/seed storage helical domain-containing protein [Hirschfeldia incana]|nr:Bifunctional inhibitor/plant lipid transfer protein/seed storage helical domain-containing protein [Hirschfeldia incana]
MMKQSLILSILLLLSSSFAPIHARNKPHPANSPSPVTTPAPGPSNTDCSSVIYDMMDCLTFLTPGSNDTKPTKVCCGGIQSVVQYNPNCVCIGLASSKDMGIALNNTRALAMPTICKLPVLPPHCTILDAPSASTPGTSSVSPSAVTPMTSPSSAQSPTSSPSLAESPGMTATPPSSSGTNHLSVSMLTFVFISFFYYLNFGIF